MCTCMLAAHSFLRVRSLPVTCVAVPQFEEPATRHLGCSWFLTLMNKVAMHILVQVFCVKLSFLDDKHLGTEFLGYMVNVRAYSFQNDSWLSFCRYLLDGEQGRTGGDQRVS